MSSSAQDHTPARKAQRPRNTATHTASGADGMDWTPHSTSPRGGESTGIPKMLRSFHPPHIATYIHGADGMEAPFHLPPASHGTFFEQHNGVLYRPRVN